MSPPVPLPDEPRPRRKFSAWTVLAPATLLVVVVAMFNALGESCIFDRSECEKKASASAASKDSDSGSKTTTGGDNGEQAKPERVRRRYQVRSGDTTQSIAARFELTEEELKACNPHVDDFTVLQVDTWLSVEPKKCTGKDDGVI